LKITKEKCQQIIDYNTKGKGKGDPNFTDLANAKIWLANLEFNNKSEANLPWDSWFLNDAEMLRMKNREGDEWYSLISQNQFI